MNDRALLTASAVVLAVALVASGAILVKAWRNMSPSPELERARARLNTTMDEVQAELAANESLLRIRAVPASHPRAADLQAALSDAARATRDALSRSADERFPVQFAAVAFHAAGDSGDVWLASPLGTDDTTWLRSTLAKLASRDDASAYESEESRSIGVAVATFDVAGEKRRGGLYWMLAKR